MTAEVDIKPAADGASLGSGDYDDPYAMNGLENLPEIDIPLRSLSPGFYLRQAGMDASHIRLLAEAADSVELQPILVQRNGSRVIDGMHRIEAAKLRGEQSIRARFVDCTDAEALVFAIRSNVLHGLPLSRADRISGAKRILAAHRDWSDRAVAGVVGLNAKTIALLRNRSTEELQFHGKRLGRDGKRRPLSAAEGRKRAAEYIDSHPEASLREVAREADVSLGTVHDVRERIRSGTEHLTGKEGRSAEEVRGRSSTGVTACPPLQATVLGVHAEKRNPAQLDWPTISSKLAGDPTLKYTEGGRAFLRWMAAHATQADRWREFTDAIPAYWLRDVSQVADSVSAEWREFAQWLRRRQAVLG